MLAFALRSLRRLMLGLTIGDQQTSLRDEAAEQQ
jgi:hypothetical protein